jgi:WD40 repeat protein
LSAGNHELLTIGVTPNHEAELRSWDLAGKRSSLLQTIVLPVAAGSNAAGVWAMGSDRRWLACGDTDGIVSVWRLTGPSGSSKPISPVPLSHPMGEGSGVRGIAQRQRGGFSARPVTQLAFSSDRGTLAALQPGPTERCLISLWSLRQNVEAGGTIDIQPLVNAFAWSPDGSSLAAACDDHTVQLWDARTRRLIRTLAGHKRGVTAVAFSPDGRTLASGDGRTIKLWQASTGREMLTVSREIKLGDPLRWLAFTRDGARLLAADEGGRIQFFVAASKTDTAINLQR